MTTDDNDTDVELDGHAMAMIAAYRAEETLPGTVEDRVWARVEGDVAAPAGGVAAKWTVALLAAAAAIAATVVGVKTLTPTESEQSVQQAPYTHEAEAPQQTAPRAEPAATPSKLGAGPGVAPSLDLDLEPDPEPDLDPAPDLDRPSPSPSPRPRPRPRSAAKAPTHDAPPRELTPEETLAAETRMLKRAQAAVRTGNPSKALLTLAECRQRFPNGVLKQERTALRAIALCDAGRDAEGQKAAAAFFKAHPGSALAARVRKACNQ